MISLELMSPSMEATHPEMRVAVDLTAGTHMLLNSGTSQYSCINQLQTS